VDFEPAGFEWMDCSDADQSVIAFVRRARDPRDILLVVCSFTPVPRRGYRVGVPREGFYRELLNTDAAVYGGSNVGNGGGVWAEPLPLAGQPWSVTLTLPPLGVVVLKPGPA
jgi:1,4-alpha-glucan branching enzyme